MGLFDTIKGSGLRWIVALACGLGFLGACVKVEHLGESTSKSFDRVFNAQTRTSTRGGQWRHQPMEAELGKISMSAMSEKPKRKVSRGEGSLSPNSGL